MIGNVIETVKNTMIGRMCDEQDNVRYLLEAVRDAGDGDYLEIGVLHGGSLCAVALLKKLLGQRGMCYGIDPLDGFYMDTTNKKWRGSIKDPIFKLRVTPEIVHDNAERLGVRDKIRVFQDKSDPLPLPFIGRFAVAYIDGDHWGEAPVRDWVNINPLVTGYVVIDNDDDLHPDVQRACELAINDVRWDLHLRKGITCIVRRHV